MNTNTYTVIYDSITRQMTIAEMAELYTFAWIAYLNRYEPASAALIAKDIANKKEVDSLNIQVYQNYTKFESQIKEALDKNVHPFLYTWRCNTPDEIQLADTSLQFVQFLHSAEFEGIENDPEIDCVRHQLLRKRNLMEKMNACRICNQLKPLTFEELKSRKGKKIAVVVFDDEGVNHDSHGLLGIDHVDEFVVESVLGNDNKMWIMASDERNTRIYSRTSHRGQFVYASDDQFVYFVDCE